MKAFLSHSHHDEDIVQSVAAQIGRAFVTIDTAAFNTAEDLIDSIQSAVRDSAIFVYFASQASKASSWVNFEVDEARYHQSLSRVRKLIVVLLDDRLQPTDFPDWMRRYAFLKSHAARPIARAIRSAIDDMVGEEQGGFFVGRANETAALQAAFVSPDASSDVSLVTVRGLPGIGRRTLLKRVAKDSLCIDRLLTVRVEIGDDANSITAKLADLVEPVVTPDESLSMVRHIQGLPTAEACARFGADVKRALDLHELVVLYDEGGILDNDGSPTPATQSLLQEIIRRPSLLLALVTNRRPKFADVVDLSDTPIVDVAPLRETEVKQLLALKANAMKMDLPPGTLGALTEQVKGYPPSATALMALAQTYGPEIVTNPPSGAALYYPRPLRRYLTELPLASVERKMVAVLAKNSPLPLSILAEFAPQRELAISALATLIDASLVIPQIGTPWYRISDPVIDCIDEGFPPCTIDDYSLIAHKLDQFLSEDTDAGAYLDLSRVLYRALTHAGKEQLPRAYALLADWLRLAAEFYHQRNYEKALRLATLAYRETPSPEALSWMIRADVKLGNIVQASQNIGILRDIGQVRDAYFLRGFLERNRGNYETAIKNYELAKQAGWRGVALDRDLAECYLQAPVPNLGKALEHIQAAQSRQSENPYVVTLRIQIACRMLDEKTARSLLPILKQVDKSPFVAHRQSLVELTFGNVEDALKYALAAVENATRPPAEALSNLAHCQILVGQADEAIRTLNRLEKLYGNRWSDVLNGLRARAALSQQRYEDALAYCDMLVRDNVMHMRVKRDALRGLLEHVYLPPDERREKEEILAELSHRLLLVDSGDRSTDFYWEIGGH